MKFELKPDNRNASDKDLLDDLIVVAKQLGKEKITIDSYNELGRFSASTLMRRFGNWTRALSLTGLEISKISKYTNEELFENLENVWIKLGRQPNYPEVKQPLSPIYSSIYFKRFGSWRKALEAFVEYMNKDVDEQPDVTEEIKEPIIEKVVFKHQTKREPSSRLKVQVLMKDGNKCRLCGITVTGDNIHFDHIKPWSKGGETILENLQVLCAEHNLAKGNLE